MSDTAVLVEGLSKQFHIGAKLQRYKTMRDTITEAATAPYRAVRGALRRSGGGHAQGDTTIWALKDISFEVKRGQAIGIIGRNGAGKSTLLKILSRITEPTEGYADIHGRIGSLLEVGTGFHPELSGRENIYLNSAILGMKKAVVERKFDEIVDFAEVEKFIDTPVKHYSSGMYLRLAFAVAAHLEPEILVVDEVLAVGDAAFQRKCLGKMQEVGEGGQTVLFVSHDMTAISRLAAQTLVLQDGRAVFFGPTSEAIRIYTTRQHSTEDNLAERKDRTGDGVVRIESLQFYDSQGQTINHIGSGEPVTVAISYSSEAKNLRYEDIAFDMRFTDVLGHPVTTFSTRFGAAKSTDAMSRKGVLVCHIPSLTLAEETYAVDLWLAYRGGLSDNIIRAGELQVVTSDYFGTGQEPVKRKHGAALIKHEWTVDAESASGNVAVMAGYADKSF